jgi:hypothetical protein
MTDEFQRSPNINPFELTVVRMWHLDLKEKSGTSFSKWIAQSEFAVNLNFF